MFMIGFHEFPTIRTLPDGEIILLPGMPPVREVGERVRTSPADVSTCESLAAVYAVKDSLPDTMREAADRFVHAALEHLAKTHRPDEVLIIPNDVHRYWDGPPNGNR